jgi:hypothetical protein
MVQGYNLCGVGTASGLPITVDPCTGIAPVQGKTHMDVFPNPSRGLFNLAVYNNTNSSATVRVYDILGKLVHQENVSLESGITHLEVDLSSLLPGVYSLTLQDQTQRLMKPIVINP